MDRTICFTALYKKAVVILFLVCSAIFAYATEETGQAKAPEGEEEGFNAGEMIIDHIIDAHEWHIAEVGETAVSIPLPIILIDQGKLVTFMSSEFHHGQKAYNGYRLMMKGPYKGKIVKVKSDGLTVDEAAALPLDFSITKGVLTIFISVILLCLIFISVARKYKKNPGAPKGLQSVLEPVILFVRDDIVYPALGPKRAERYMPYLLTVFFFIFFTNLLGLIPFFPGGANVTGNIAVTMVLALFTFVITTFSGNRSYWGHIINTPGVPWWIKIPIPMMPLVELIGVFTKPFTLMIRLFANITAGHVIVLGFMALIFIFGNFSLGGGYGISIVSVIFSVFISLIELLVAFIQAYVFTMLSAFYFSMATEKHHAHEEEHAH